MPFSIKFNNVKEYYNKFNLIFHLLIAVPLLGFVVLYLEIHAGRLEPVLNNPFLVNVLRYFFLFIIILTAGLAFIYFLKHIEDARKEMGLKNKLRHYFSIGITKYAFLEASTTVSVIGLWLTNENIYAVLYIIVLMIFSVNRPTVYRISRDLKLKDIEKEVVIKKKELPYE